MVTVIKKGTPLKDILAKLNRLLSGRKGGIDSSKYSGKLKLKTDPLDYQKSMRDEWE